MTQQPHVVFLARLHVHHQAGVQITQLRGLGKRLVQVHLPSSSFAARAVGPEPAAKPGGQPQPPLKQALVGSPFAAPDASPSPSSRVW